MEGHDPLCTLAIGDIDPSVCRCSLYAAVRADERQKCADRIREAIVSGSEVNTVGAVLLLERT